MSKRKRSVAVVPTMESQGSTTSTKVPSKPAPESASLPAHKYAHIRHWLMKNEPPYSLTALRALPHQTEAWVGVRNAEARNLMQHCMRQGDLVLYYNASISNPHIAGVARVCSEQAYPDPSAFDATSPYFDAHSDPSHPKWYLVDVQYEREFIRPVYLAELKHIAASGGSKLINQQFTLFRRNRLSIHPLTPEEFDAIVELEKTALPKEVQLKPEKEGADAVAHPSRNRSVAKGKKDKRKAIKETQEEGSAAMESKQEDQPAPAQRRKSRRVDK